MLKFIMRLDDACPTMCLDKWNRIERLFDKYSIKPIVGIIPDNKDEEFTYKYNENFWNLALSWQEKGWIIAQHGLNHNLSKKVRTEFKGKKYEEQVSIIKKGYDILNKKGIKPICFFAPAHTFDKNTIKACLSINEFKFISDGNALYPYKKNNMLFVPSIFDTPHKITNHGIFTFIYHPNNMSDFDFEYLEDFIKKYRQYFDVNLEQDIYIYDKKKKMIDYILGMLITIYRFIMKIKKWEW